MISTQKNEDCFKNIVTINTLTLKGIDNTFKYILFEKG